jgi:hypothetical protein
VPRRQHCLEQKTMNRCQDSSPNYHALHSEAGSFTEQFGVAINPNYPPDEEAISKLEPITMVFALKVRKMGNGLGFYTGLRLLNAMPNLM